MEEQVYRLRIVLDGGGVIDADVTDPLIELTADRTRIARFDWQNPPDKGRSCLSYVDPTKIVALTVEELPTGRIAFDERPRERRAN